MTDEVRKQITDAGWDGYFGGKTLEDCPDYPTQEERDEWVGGWYMAQSADLQDPYEHL